MKQEQFKRTTATNFSADAAGRSHSKAKDKAAAVTPPGQPLASESQYRSMVESTRSRRYPGLFDKGSPGQNTVRLHAAG